MRDNIKIVGRIISIYLGIRFIDYIPNLFSVLNLIIRDDLGYNFLIIFGTLVASMAILAGCVLSWVYADKVGELIAGKKEGN